MISILTVTNGRELYLYRLLESIKLLSGYDKVDFEYFLVFQEKAPSAKMTTYLEGLPFYGKMHIGQSENQQPIGTVINASLAKAQHPIFFKIDDDNILLTPDFFPRIVELCEKMPQAVIYPLVIDGETPLHSRVESRQTVFCERNNVYITVGSAPMCSGKYIIPTRFGQMSKFPNQQNDAEYLMMTAIRSQTPIFQTCNSLVIENQEGYSGQSYRRSTQDGQVW